MTTRPRHEEIADYLRALVAETEPEGRMPSDAELCERFTVSRMTARQAVQTMVNEGLVYRKRGHGTFRAPNRVHRVLGSPLSFTENMHKRGLKASSRLLTLTTTKVPPAIADSLGIEPTEEAILLERLRFAGGLPMAIERATISPRCPEVLDSDLSTGSLHEVFEAAGHFPVKAEASVSARRATKKERDLLELPSTGVVLVEDRVISDQDDLPLEHTTTCYAAHRYAFDAVVYRGETKAEQ